MNVAIVTKWRGGALHNIFEPLAKELGATYLTVNEILADIKKGKFDTTFSKFDLVHFTYFANITFFEDIEVPVTASAHHFDGGKEKDYLTLLEELSPSRIVVPEPFIQRQLGQHDILGVVKIPYAFDHAGFKPTPYPKEFTVGALGTPRSFKRIHIIEEACKKAGVKFVELSREADTEDVNYLGQDKIHEFYDSINVLVCASWNEGGPLPPQEAMLCGRGVITTPVGMMLGPPISNYADIEYFDGTVSGLVEQIEGWQSRGCDPYLASKLARNCLYKIPGIAHSWRRMFEDVVEEWN